MGYKPEKKYYQLNFADYPGLEVHAKGTSLGKLVELQSMDINLAIKNDTEKMKLFTYFSTRIITWNVEHPEIDEPVKNDYHQWVCPQCNLAEGDPLPTSVDGLKCLELGFVMSLITGWMQGITRVAVPKSLSFNDGEMNSQLESLMNQIENNQNQQTLPTPNFS